MFGGIVGDSWEFLGKCLQGSNYWTTYAITYTHTPKPTKYKKLLELNIFDENKLKTFRKKYKLDLKKESKLIELVKYFNEN